MRVLVLTNLYPRPHRETFATFNREQFHALAREHQVRMVTPVPWTEEVRDRIAGRVTTHSRETADGIKVDYPIYFFLPKVAPQAYGWCFFRSIRGRFRQVVREFRPDLIFSAWAHPDGWAATLLAKEAGLPCVVKVHGSDVLVNAKSGKRRAQIADGLKRADKILVVSEDLKRHVVELGVDSSRVIVFHEGLDGEKFYPGDKQEARARLNVPTDKRQILFVGNLLLSKGLGVLIDACRMIKERGEPFECRVVGRGKQEALIRERIQNAGLVQEMILVGPRPHSELPDWYRAADFLVLPSFSEGIPNVLRESLACGCPFVSTTVGGIPEISDPLSSILVPPGDPASLADALTKMLNNLPSQASVAATSRHISWAETASRSTTLFQSLFEYQTAVEVGKT